MVLVVVGVRGQELLAALGAIGLEGGPAVAIRQIAQAKPLDQALAAFHAPLVALVGEPSQTTGLTALAEALGGGQA